MEVLKTVSLSEGINFNLYKGPLGLLCSGGADSSLMLYFVLKNYTGKDPIHVFDPLTILRFKKTVAVTKVVNKCVELTGT